MTAPSTSLTGKRVVVIGGSAGIGFGVAEAANAEGASVIVGSSQAGNIETAMKRLGAGASGFVVDVSDEASVAAFFQRVGGFDHLAFTAGDWGGSFYAPVRDLDIAAQQAGMTVRFWGALLAVKYGCRTIAEDGSITLTGGMLAHRPMKGAPVVTAMAGAIEHLVRGLAVDLAPIRVNAVCPGMIRTGRTDSMPQEMLKAVTSRLPLPRIGEPAETAQAYLYLMRGGYTTGQVMLVDGGGAVV
jgi:NAD(P)-dependent dehydrogenase (short-subunit alcohol dehydrogenase family)